MKFFRASSVSVAGVLALVLFAAHVSKATADEPAAVAVVDAKGNLRVPANYRTSYQFLGTWAVQEAPDKSPNQLHIVYASPGTIAAYRKHKRFPDGSVLVKEVFQTDTGPMKTGIV